MITFILNQPAATDRSRLSGTSLDFRVGLQLSGVMVRTLDLPSRGRRFDFQSGRYQVVAIWMGDCQTNR